MEPRLQESIAAIFGMEQPPPATTPAPAPPVPPETVSSEVTDLIAEAQEHYDQAQQYLKDGDWSGYGEELAALKDVLDRLAELTTD